MDFKRAWDTITNMAGGFIAALPNLILAFIIFIIFLFDLRVQCKFLILDYLLQIFGDFLF